MLDILWAPQPSWLCTTTDQILGKSKLSLFFSSNFILNFRIRLANLLAPVASEANMGGPLGWIAGLGIDSIVDVG